MIPLGKTIKSQKKKRGLYKEPTGEKKCTGEYKVKEKSMRRVVNTYKSRE